MVKRKSVAPQRMCEERRSELTWDLTENDEPLLGHVSKVDIRHDNGSVLQADGRATKDKLNSKRFRRKSQLEDEVTDKYLRELLTGCAFYLPLRKNLEFNKNERAFQLGKLSLAVQTNCITFPKDGECWLYVSEFPDRSLLYVECPNGITYFLIDGTLDFQFYSGLALRCFALTFGGFIEETGHININVLFRESHCRGPMAHWEVKQRSASQDFQAVISHFFGIITPVYDGMKEVRKHNTEALYQAVKKHHENAPSKELPFMQHSSLVPRLRPYQIQAVEWMLCRESEPGATSDDELHCLYTELVTPDGQLLFYNKYAGYITLEKPKAVKLPPGGILADEMGLGKTVEVLACLLANQRPASEGRKGELNIDLKHESVLNAEEVKHEDKIEQDTGSKMKSMNNIQGENSCDLSCKKSDIQYLSLANMGASATEHSTSISVDGENSVIKTEEADESTEIHLVDLSMECDVAANVFISTCGEISMGGDSNSCNVIGALENCGEKSSKSAVVLHKSETSSGIDVENSNSNTCETSHTGDGAAKNMDKTNEFIQGDNDSQGSLNSDIVHDIDNFDLDSDEDDEGSFMKLRNFKGRKQRKRCKVKPLQERKERLRNVVAKRGAICKYKNKRKKVIRVEKGKRSCTDSVQETIEEVISKFCYANGAVNYRKRKYKQVTRWREASQIWYRGMLSVVTLRKPQSIRELAKGTVLECVCGSDEDNDKSKVRCFGCGRWQHAQCVGFKQMEGGQEGSAYCCPQCWQAQEPVLSGATLIVSPASISNQWVTEIQRHVNQENFNILVYRGVHKDGFLQPHDLAKYKVVLTTYETLRRELNYADLNTTDGHRLRHVKRFLAPPSPLPCVQWWRLCLDEAQMVEGTGSKTAEMARRLGAVHRWAITGTPVQKSMHDLFGLVQFLGIDPQCDLRWWQDLVYGPYCQGNCTPLYNLMAEIMWRTAKKDVTHRLTFQIKVKKWSGCTFSSGGTFLSQATF